LLPPRPSFGSPGTLGSSTSSSPYRSFSKPYGLSSLALRRHLSVFFLRLPQPLPSHVDHDPKRIVPRISCPALQHFRIRKPFFSPPVSRRRPAAVALAPGSLTLGFGYPLDEMAWLSHPWKPLSAPNALGLRSSELSSSRVIRNPSQSPPPLLRFRTKPSRPCPGAPTACSHPESRAPFCHPSV
jgi:hypothetical protein